MPIRMRASDLGELHALLIMYKQVYGGVDDGLLSDVVRNYQDAVAFSHTAATTITNPRAAGRKPRDISGEKENILKLRNDGMTIREIAAATGLSVGYVHKLIHEHGRGVVDGVQKNLPGAGTPLSGHD